MANARCAGPAKRNQKVSPLTYGPSPGLGVPSLRHSSGGIALRSAARDLHAMSSTASNGAARPSPDEHRNEACRGGGWIKIKSGRRANARPCRSELAREKRQDTAGIQTARVIVDVHREQARSHRRAEQKQGCVPPRSSPLNRPSVSSPAALDLDPPAPSAG